MVIYEVQTVLKAMFTQIAMEADGGKKPQRPHLGTGACNCSKFLLFGSVFFSHRKFSDLMLIKDTSNQGSSRWSRKPFNQDLPKPLSWQNVLNSSIQFQEPLVIF